MGNRLRSESFTKLFAEVSHFKVTLNDDMADVDATGWSLFGLSLSKDALENMKQSGRLAQTPLPGFALSNAVRRVAKQKPVTPYRLDGQYVSPVARAFPPTSSSSTAGSSSKLFALPKWSDLTTNSSQYETAATQQYRENEHRWGVKESVRKSEAYYTNPEYIPRPGRFSHQQAKETGLEAAISEMFT